MQDRIIRSTTLDFQFLPEEIHYKHIMLNGCNCGRLKIEMVLIRNERGEKGDNYRLQPFDGDKPRKYA